MKDAFIHNEIWTLTFGAAFQRANVYKSNVVDDKKEFFKTGIREFIERMVKTEYQRHAVIEKKHVKNIHSLSTFSKKFASILRNDQLNFGVSQKLLNLYLKYLWCLGKIPTPPHFPVDRRIQEELKLKSIEAWTGFTDEKKYLKIIEHVKSKLDPTCKTVADYELKHYKRRVKTKIQ